MAGTGGTRGGWLPVGVWCATRAVVVLCALRVIRLPGPDVSSDVRVIYRAWAEVLGAGAFPLGDVTWQYPPGAALAVLSPGLLPFLDYGPAFVAVVLVADAVGLALFLRMARRPGNRPAGAWVWIVGVALLGPTAYARYDLMAALVAAMALFAAARRPRVAGALVAFGALLKVWPVLVLTGAALRGRRARALWLAAAGTTAGLTVLFVAAAPGALAFLAFQRDRGTEIESLGALVFHLARHLGWSGEVLLRYGSVEFVGPGVAAVSALALALTLAALVWLLRWRLRARELGARTLPDAAFTATLLFTTTSRVISPQYLLWLVALAAVCLTTGAGRQAAPAGLVVLATGVTLLEFPVFFPHVVASDGPGVALLAVRNGLLVTASLMACRRLAAATRGDGSLGGRAAGAGGRGSPAAVRAAAAGPAPLTSAAPPRTPATPG
ncbi:glycosyltransferase 87 family protein [Streptomyces sp. NPDC053427]|uniref:glycosyltransferase 87 family protein n=1 Tax=Streptomyces sp. NPDC053427 TaxID=3365701 RepID=UPI0037D1CE9C